MDPMQGWLAEKRSEGKGQMKMDEDRCKQSSVSSSIGRCRCIYLHP